MTAQEGSLVGQTLGIYRLRSLLGVGGMAEVYLAEDPTLHRDVAVKVLPRTLASDPNYVERFRNEAQRVANLNHPNITPVYTFGDERGLFYLVMPRMKESLREKMERDGLISLQEAARLTNQIAAALYIAHQHDIVHRDVKPENILLDENGKAMLTDFGIAREMATLREAGAARTLAATGLPVGTPEYMAPEQLRGQIATEQADLYALGVVLYEMLTGRVPFDAATPYEVATAVLRDRPAAPSRFNETISPEMEQVILTAMDKDPARRFQDMKVFALALRAALTSASQPVNSGALRWTHYDQPKDAKASASGPKMGRSLTSATSSLILQPQIPIGETTKRPAVAHGASPLVAYGGMALGGARLASARLSGARLAEKVKTIPRRFSKRSALMLMSGVVALTVLTLIGLNVVNGFGLFTNSVGTPSLAVAPTTTPSPLPTARPTATAHPTATATIYVQPPPPAPLSISPSTVLITYVYNKSTCGLSTGAPIIISNLDSSKVTWKWTTSKPSLSGIGFQWRLNTSTKWQSNSLPSDSQGIAAYNGSTAHSDSLYLLVSSCGAFKSAAPFTVTMTDSLGRSYKITLKWGN